MNRWTGELTRAIRGLGRNARLSAIIVLTLALGLGANTTIFSLVKSVLFVEADFGRNTGRVVSLHSLNPSRAQQLDDAELSWPEFDAVRAAVPGLEQVEGYVQRNFTLDTEEGAVRALGASVTPGLFSLIVAQPAMGRGLADDDAQDFGFESTVVVSHALWQRQYGGDPGIVGRKVMINGRGLEVVGVMPRGFAFPERQELWVAYRPGSAPPNAARAILALGLLAPGEDVPSISMQLAPVSLDLERRLPETQLEYRMRAARFPNSLAGGAPQAMSALLAAVLMVLLIACANLAGLLVARSVERRREAALKLALGASRGSLVRELLCEVLVLSVAGAVLGWGLARLAVPRLVASFPEVPPYWMRFEVDAAAFGYCLALTLLTTLIAGLLPAWRSSSMQPGVDLKDAGRTVSHGPRTRVLQEGIVVVQVAACLALVVAAELMMQSFANLQKADAGVREEGLLTARLYLSGDDVDAPLAKARALASLTSGLAARPGVLRAAITTAIPADDGGPTAMLVQGVGTPPLEEIPATVVGVSDGLFEALGTALLRGRDFTSAEVEDPASESIMVSASLASSLGGGDVVGRAIALRSGAAHQWRTIIGVVPDVQYEEFGEETRAARRAIYVPYSRMGARTVALLARTSGSVEPLIAELRPLAKAAHPGIALFAVRTMPQVRVSTTWEDRFFARLMGLFAGAALLLAGLGLYGLLRQFVGSRTHEIGVRRALGASARQIASLVMSRAGAVTGLGLLAGTALSLGAARGLKSLLYGVEAMNPGTFAVAGVAVLMLTLVCAWIPVRRAVEVDPVVTLREE
jgi:putative ABC transport system permease protein